MYSKEKIMNIGYEIVEDSKAIKPYVVIAQPRRDLNEIPAQKFDGYEGLHIDLCGFSHGFIHIGGESVDVARNYLIDQVIESGCKYMLFVGEDTVLPYDGFRNLHKTAEENPDSIVAGIYYIKLSIPMIMIRKDEYIIPANVDPGQVYEAWQTGMDAMLIPVSILKKMKEEEPELPFCCIINNIGGIPFIGEDNFFVHRLRKHGFNLLVNTDVQCLHMDLKSGKYTAHPDIDLVNYFTQIPITTRLTMQDKKDIDLRWTERLPNNINKNLMLEILNNQISEKEVVKLNVGSGGTPLEGYYNIDKIDTRANLVMDIFDLKLPENSVDEIYSSHFLEHINPHQVNDLLRTFLFMLKPGGKIIMELPNIEGLCRDFIKEKDKDKKNFLIQSIYGTLDTITDGKTTNVTSPHVWGWTPDSLKEKLKDIGFDNIISMKQTTIHPGENFRIEGNKGV
jgi:hypothetical protein